MRVHAKWRRRLVLACASCVLGSSVHADTVSGTLDDWKMWHFASEMAAYGCIPIASPCNETERPAGPFFGPEPARPSIAVAGAIEIQDDQLVALELEQVEPVSYPIAGGEAADVMHLAGLRWRLIDGRMQQIGPAEVSCQTGASPGCIVVAKQLADPDGSDSPLDFDGIPKDFEIQLGALKLDVHDALAFKQTNSGDIALQVTSHSPSSSRMTGSLFNAAALVHFTLSMDDPGSPE